MNLSGKASLSFRAGATLSASYARTGRSLTADADYALARSWAEVASPAKLVEHEALKRFTADVSKAERLDGTNLVCFRGQRRFPPGCSPASTDLGPPPALAALANRYNNAGESVLYLCESEAGVVAELIGGSGPLWVQRFSLPIDRIAIANFSSLHGDDFLSKVFWFAELAGNDGTGVSLSFSQLVASIVSKRFDGMLVAGVRGNDNIRYRNIVVFRAESRWTGWLQTDAPPYVVSA